MALDHRRLDQLIEADLLDLVTNAVAEGTTLDYKEELPTNQDESKREFLRDATSFANTAGGHLEHDVPRKRGNWDHVAVGRAGVFVLETKWSSGSALVVGDELRFGNIPYAGVRFRRAAVELRDVLEAATGKAPWVTAVVVIWGDFEQEIVDGDRVTFVSGRLLHDWLGRQPPRLSEGRTQQLATAMRELANDPYAGHVRLPL